MNTVSAFEQHIQYQMACGDRLAVECALETELEFKRFGFPHSQNLIDSCREWISAQSFNEKVSMR